MTTEWKHLEAEIASCTRCATELAKIPVDCPPGDLYPEPPPAVRILFIAVAPPEKGRHFYTDEADGLRRGLFTVLTGLDRPCSDIPSFLAHGYFLLHTAKCPIRGTWAPSLPVSRFCAQAHLRREVELLKPGAVYWISKKVGYPISQLLAHAWGRPDGFPFGKLTSLVISGQEVPCIATAWPGRGHELQTAVDVFRILEALA